MLPNNIWSNISGLNFLVRMICYKYWWCLIYLSQSVATDWAVEAMPTFMFIKEGKIVDKVVGAKKDELQQTIAKHISSTSSA